MAEKVGEGFIEIEPRLDEDNFVRQSRLVARRAAQRFGDDYAKNIRTNLNKANEQFRVHLNDNLRAFQNLERQRVQAMEDSNRRILRLRDEISRDTLRDRRLSEHFEAEGRRAANAFIREQNAAFDNMVESYRRNLNTVERDHHSIFRRIFDRTHVDIDRHSGAWGRLIGRNIRGGIDGILSLLPSRLEFLFTRTGIVAGTSFITAFALALSIGLPALGAMVLGAFGASLGLGAAIAAAVVGAVEDPRVESAANRLAQKFKDRVIFAMENQNLGQVLSDQLDKVNEALDRWVPHINSILQAGARFLPVITNGLIGFVDAILPAMDRFLNSTFVTDLVEITARGIRLIGEAFGVSLERIMNDPKAMEGAKKGLEDFFNILASGVKLTFDLLRALSRLWEFLNDDPDDGGPQKSPLDRMREVWREIRDVIGRIVAPIVKEAIAALKEAFDGLSTPLSLVWEALKGIGDWLNDPENEQNIKNVTRLILGMTIAMRALNLATRATTAALGAFAALGGLGLLTPGADKKTKLKQGAKGGVAGLLLGTLFSDDAGLITGALAGGIAGGVPGGLAGAGIGAAMKELLFSEEDQKEIDDGFRELASGHFRTFFDRLKEDWANADDEAARWWNLSVVPVTKRIWNDFTSDFREEMGVAGRKLKDMWNNFWQESTQGIDPLQDFKSIWGRFRTAFSEEMGVARRNWNDFTAALGGAWRFIWDRVSSWFSERWQGFTENFSIAKDAFQRGWGAVGTFIGNTWNNAWGGIKKFFQDRWADAFSAIQSARGIFETMWNNFTGFISGVWNSAWSRVKQFFQDRWNDAFGVIQGARTLFETMWNNFTNFISNIWNSAWSRVRDFFRDRWNEAFAFIQGARVLFETMWNNFTNWISNRWNDAWNAVKQFFQDRWADVMGVVDAARIGFETMWNNFTNFISQRWNDMWEGIKSFLERFRQPLEAAAQGVVGAIISTIQAGIDAINEMLKKIGLSSIQIPRINNPFGGRRGGSGTFGGSSRRGGSGTFASGGYVSGPGSGTSDSIPAFLSNGEYVINAESTKKFLPMLDKMNSNSFAKGGIVGYALGGRVGSRNSGLLDQHRDHVHVAHSAGVAFIIELAKRSGIPFRVSSTVRPGDRVASGGLSWHSSGKAVDFGGFNQDRLAAYFAGIPGVLELIHRTGRQDYAIFGGAAATAMAAINEWLLKPWGEVLSKMVRPAIEKLWNKLPGHGLGKMFGGMMKHISEKGLIGWIKKEFDKFSIDGLLASFGGGAASPQLKSWIAQAMRITGVPGSWANGLLTLIMRESGGNPRAVNRWDSNARAGTPSMGLAQVIGPTFAANRHPGLPNDPFHPVANIAAAIRYIQRRYGDISRVQQANPRLPPKGYDNGGPWMPGQLGINTSGKPEMVLNHAQASALERRIDGGGDVYVTVKLGDEVILDKVAGQINKNNYEITQSLRRGRGIGY